MTTDQYERIEELFNAALALDAPERAAYLDEHAREPEIRRRVEAMLRMDETAASSFETPAMLSALRSGIGEIDDDSPLPQQIGRYRVIRRLGAGGMGIVYEAEQDSPKRRVALKVMRPGSYSRKMLHRFEIEAHVLGQLHHPGIAQIYESGVAEMGGPAFAGGDPQPYFAMELIEGQPLKEYVRRSECSIPQRLALVAQIAEAVHHAHQKGVVHRDLKPDNVLVDERGQPKILDFGVARATDSDMMVTTLQTDAGQIIGTLAYMSPEQVAGPSGYGGSGAQRVDARSDVYSLGVLMYELLTGELPLDVTSRSVPAALRMIQESEPRRLSDINVHLRGDLETIVAKAMEKDRARRYQSAIEFAADIRRYLNDEPIVARPASAMYQFRKFAKRNKAIVGGAAGIFASVTLGLLVATWFAVKLSHERREAVAARDDAQEQRDAANELAYRSTVAAASAALAAEDYLTAQAHLEQAPGDLRGWEWRHLRTRLDAATLVTEPLGGRITDVALIDGNDGPRIYAIAGGRVNVLDAATRRPISTAGALPSNAMIFAFSPDGSRALVEDARGSAGSSAIAMYDIEDEGVGTWRELWRVESARAGRDVFSPDGTVVAVALPGESAVAWLDARDGTELRRQRVEGGRPFHVAYPHDARAPSAALSPILYVTREDIRGSAGIALPEGRLTESERHSLYSRPVFAPSERMLAWEVWTDGRVFTLDLEAGPPRDVPERVGRERVPLAWAPATPSAAARWLAIGDEREVLIWDLDRWSAFALLPGHEHTVTAGRFSSDGQVLLTGDDGGVVRLWSMPPARSPWIVSRWENWRQMHGDLAPDERTLATVGWSFVRLWDLPTGVIRSIHNQGSRYVDRVAFSPDGRRIATAARDRGVRILDATAERAGTVLLQTNLTGNRPIAWRDDGDALFWLGRDGAVDIVEFSEATGELAYSVVGRLVFDDAPMHLMAVAGSVLFAAAWTPSSNEIMTPRAESHTTLLGFDLSARRLIAKAAIEGDALTSMAVRRGASPVVAIGDAAGRVELWTLPNGAGEFRQLWSIEGLGGATERVDSIAISRDGTRIAVGRVAGIDLLDAATGAGQATLPHDVGRVVALGFTAGDAALVVCGENHPVAIFDASAGEVGLPAGLLRDRSRFRQARLIAEPLFDSFIASRRVVERLRAATDLTESQREAAIEYAQRRGDHLAAMASDAIFAVRRGEYEAALIRYETIRDAAGASGPLFDPACAMLHFLLGRQPEAQECLDRAMNWPDRPTDITAAEWALSAMVAEARNDPPAQREAWRRAQEIATAQGEPTADLERLIWLEAISRFEGAG